MQAQAQMGMQPQGQAQGVTQTNEVVQ